MTDGHGANNALSIRRHYPRLSAILLHGERPSNNDGHIYNTLTPSPLFYPMYRHIMEVVKSTLLSVNFARRIYRLEKRLHSSQCHKTAC